jgi:antirestriction protein ArdC
LPPENPTPYPLPVRTGRGGASTFPPVAELGAAFLCADLGISDEPRADHARYLTTWLAVLKEDKKAIFTAASKASGAAGFLASLRGA